MKLYLGSTHCLHVSYCVLLVFMYINESFVTRSLCIEFWLTTLGCDDFLDWLITSLVQNKRKQFWRKRRSHTLLIWRLYTRRKASCDTEGTAIKTVCRIWILKWRVCDLNWLLCHKATAEWVGCYLYWGKNSYVTQSVTHELTGVLNGTTPWPIEENVSDSLPSSMETVKTGQNITRDYIQLTRSTQSRLATSHSRTITTLIYYLARICATKATRTTHPWMMRVIFTGPNLNENVSTNHLCPTTPSV